MESLTWVLIRTPEGRVSLEYLFPDNVKEIQEAGFQVRRNTPLLFEEEEPRDVIVAVLPERLQEILSALAAIAEAINPAGGSQELQKLLNAVVQISIQEGTRYPERIPGDQEGLLGH